MKKYIYILPILALMVCSCGEKELSIEPQMPKYNILDSDTDPIQHLRYEFYKNYNVILIDDVDSSDFMYTISPNKLDFNMVPSTKTVEEKIEIFKAFEDAFLKKYSADFVKKYAPLKLIIADKISRIEEDKFGMPGDKIVVNYPYFINNTLLAVSTRPEDFFMKDGLPYNIDQYGQESAYGDLMISQIVIKNILIARYGKNWHQLFLSSFGIIRPYLRFDDYSGIYEFYCRLDFDDRYYNPEDPNNPLRRPASEYPGVHDDAPLPANQNYAEIEAYFNKLGFPNIKYYRGNPSFNEAPDGSSYYARIKLSMDQIIPLWIEWSSKYTEAEKQTKFQNYPELRKNYLVTKELLKKYADINI